MSVQCSDDGHIRVKLKQLIRSQQQHDSLFMTHLTSLHVGGGRGRDEAEGTRMKTKQNKQKAPKRQISGSRQACIAIF